MGRADSQPTTGVTGIGSYIDLVLRHRLKIDGCQAVASNNDLLDAVKGILMFCRPNGE